MKKYIGYLILLFLSINGYGQSDYYWYKGQKIKIQISKNQYYISSEDSSILERAFVVTNAKISKVNGSGSYMEGKIKKYFQIVDVQSTNNSQSLDIKSIYNYRQAPSTLRISPVIEAAHSVGTSEYFYVQLKNPVDSILLFEQAKLLSCKVLAQVDYMPLWYKLEAPLNSNGLDQANMFYETGKFKEIDPGFIFNFRSNDCTDDPLFSQQWGLKNNTYSGIDVSACNAWTITRGASSIIVAVVDQGIDQTHQEFANNFSNQSFDLINNSSPSVVRGNHGTHVGGIIGANQNGIQVSGIAPLSTLLSISHSLAIVPDISQKLASGISYAWQHGASAINNSWGDQGGAYYGSLYSALLDNAISTAISSGRNGLGTVVVFAAGNYSSAGLDYPANSNSDILTVGSIQSNGTRSSFSAYGNTLDVVAPGSDILSTLPNNATGTMSGTSMAAPFVSGIVSLILSVNPNLTGQQVRDIIESTSKKIGGYNYNQNKPNGTWNSEMGYGLVDAYNALLQVQGNGGCTTVTTYNNQTVNGNNSVTGCIISSANVVVNNGTLTMTATNYTTISPVFTVNNGAALTLQ